jgi:hypothetical protein
MITKQQFDDADDKGADRFQATLDKNLAEREKGKTAERMKHVASGKQEKKKDVR